MFTEMPPLAQRIERMMDETPLIDPHTHLRCDQPNAPDLASLLSYHWVRSELIASGMPPNDFHESVAPADRVRRAIPYLKRMRNTAMSWCLRRILRDLYDFLDPVVTEANLESLFEKVAASGSDPNWARTVLGERCGIKTFVTSLGNAGDHPPVDAKYMLDAHYLFCPGVATDLEPFFSKRTRKDEYLLALTQILGEAPATPERLRQQLGDWLEGVIQGKTRFTNTFIPIEQRFRPPDLAATRSALSRSAAGQALSEDDLDAIIGFVVWTLLEWHHDHRKAVQIAVGAEYFICDGKSIPRFQETWFTEMCRAFHHFGQVRFDLMMASDVLTHETSIVARQFPNVYVSGYWWHNFFPSTIEKIIGMRLETTPMVKIGGFLCDAYYSEWTYGKWQVIKQGMVRSLVRLVESRFFDEDDLPAILRQILHDTPLELYELGD